MNKNLMIGICYALFFGITIHLQAQNNSADPWMKYTKPSDAGFDETKLKEVEQQYGQMRSASFMVVHKGKVLLAFGDISRRFMTHSMRKSFMSALYGIYVAKGEVNLYKTLEELKIDDKQGLSASEKSARVLDLITARSGIYHPAAYEPRSMKKNRPERGSQRPGELFFYNNWDFNTLLPILEQEAGINFFDEFQKQIAAPLGMEDLRSQDMRYRTEPDLSKYPAYLFRMSARDLARFAQLYLNEGEWNGNQIIPKNWIEESTRPYSINLPGFSNRDGYGYLWWVDNSNFDQPAYYASGLGGHVAYVLPKSDLVIVHRVNSYLEQQVASQSIIKLVQLVLAAQTGEASSSPKLERLNVAKKEYPKVAVSGQEFGSYEGDYTHPFFGKISVVSEDGKFFVKGEILGTFRIFPATKTNFIIEDLPELPLTFAKSNAENPKGKAITKQNERRIPTEFVMYY